MAPSSRSIPVASALLRRRLTLACCVTLPAGLAAQASGAPPAAGDEYTRYELLAPGSARFRILYEVSATTPGARFFLNPIRKGSLASDEAVYDRATGAPLPFQVVDGTTARTLGVAQADTADRFIQ